MVTSTEDFLFNPRSRQRGPKTLTATSNFQGVKPQNIATPIGPPKLAEQPNPYGEIMKAAPAVAGAIKDVDWDDWSWDSIWRTKAERENMRSQKVLNEAQPPGLPEGDKPFLAEGIAGDLKFSDRTGTPPPGMVQAPAGPVPAGAVMQVPEEYRSVIAAAADAYGVPRNILTGLIFHESKFNPRARGPVDEEGIAQFRPATARDFGINPWDSTQAINAAARYLQRGFRQTGNWEGALASYNRGFGGVPSNPGALPYVQAVMAASRNY